MLASLPEENDMSIEAVVIGTSLDPASDPVVAAGIAIARRAGARAYLAHAYPLPAAYYGMPAGMTAVHPQLLEAEKSAQLERVAAQLDRLGVEASEIAGQVVEIGVAHRLLLETAESTGAGLIVVGAHEGGGLGALLGSTAERVLRKAGRPVLVARGELPLPPSRVLAPVDLSPLSEDALRRGLDVLDQLAGEEGKAAIEVEALFVLSELERRGSVHFTPEQVDRFAREELDRLLTRVDPQGERCLRARVRDGLPRHEIQAELAARPADLVLIGTHGHSGFERLLLGSVTASVVRQSPCSVLVVPPTAAAVERAERDDADHAAGAARQRR